MPRARSAFATVTSKATKRSARRSADAPRTPSSLALRDIRRNVLRSSLTMLGIIIGVARGDRHGHARQRRDGPGHAADIASLGSNLLIVMPGAARRPGGASGSAKPFRRQDVDAIERESPAVTAVAPVSVDRLSVIGGARNCSDDDHRHDQRLLRVRDWQLAIGRVFTDERASAPARAVCIIGETVRENLFPAQRSARQPTPDLRSLSCTVDRAAAVKGRAASGRTRTTSSLMPLRTRAAALHRQRRRPACRSRSARRARRTRRRRSTRSRR